MISKYQVLAFFESEGRGLDTVALMLRFRLSDKAANDHLARLAKQHYLASTSGRRFTLTERGRKWLAWARGEAEEPAGRIEFR